MQIYVPRERNNNAISKLTSMTRTSLVRNVDQGYVFFMNSPSIDS